MKRLSILPLLLAGVCANAADYSKCAGFINVDPPEGERRGHAMRSTGPFLPNRLYYNPFRLEADGEIVPNPHGVDGVLHTTSNEQNATVHVFDYPIPSLVDLQSASIEEVRTKPDRTRKARVTITQRPNTMEVIEDLNLGPDELDAAPTLPELEHFVPQGTRTVYDIEAGECTPRVRSEALGWRHGADPRTRTRMLTFYMPLCQEIKDYIDGEPSIQGVFSDEVNEAMASIFYDHDPLTQGWAEGQDRTADALYLRTKSWSELAAARTNPKGPLASVELLSVASSVSNQRNHAQKEMSGFSPVIAGYMALAHCFAAGLWDVLNAQGDSNTADQGSPVAGPPESSSGRQ